MIHSKVFKIVFVLSLIFNFAKAGDDLHKVSLNKEHLDIPSFKFSIDSIIDARTNKYLIGSVQKGMVNSRYPADFTKGLKKEIENLVYVPTLRKEGKLKIVLIFNSLWIDEWTTAISEKGLVDLDFYIAKVTEKGILILDEQEIFLEEGGMDVTAGHARRIVKALQNGLENFNKLDSSKYLNTLFETKTYSPDSSILLTKKPFKKGVFETPLDLLYNRPNDKITYFKNIEFTETNAIVKDENINRSEMKKVFAFSDGKDLFVNAISYGVRNKQGYSFGKGSVNGTVILLTDRIRNVEAQILARAAFGLVGAALSSGATREIELYLDVRKGIVLPLEGANIKFSLREFPDLLAKFDNLPYDQQADIHVLKAFLKAINKRLETTSQTK